MAQKKYGRNLIANSPVIRSQEDELDNIIAEQPETAPATTPAVAATKPATTPAATADAEQGRVEQPATAVATALNDRYPAPAAPVPAPPAPEKPAAATAPASTATTSAGIPPRPPRSVPGDRTAVQALAPNDLYDRLDALQKRTKRTGNKDDVRTIGELALQALVEFIEKYE